MNSAIATWAENIVILDESHQLHSYDPMMSFAKDELLCKQAAQHNITICRIWRHPNAFILGQQDARLPNAKQAMDWLQDNHYMPIVRNSGGAAVPLDEGVVNISLIFPNDENGGYRDDFEKMYQLIAAALTPIGAVVQKGEVIGAYCPGDYDLSIAGRKFCGIAQRRQLKAYCVQAFVIASGSGKHRTGLVRRFYEIAGGGDPNAKHPQVTDESTASLAELTLLEPPAHESFTEAVKQVIQASYSNDQQQQLSGLAANKLVLPSNHEVAQMAQQLRARYSIF